MSSTPAIIGLTIRQLFRSGVAPMCAVILLLLSVGIPLVVTGDGTPNGYAELAVSYTVFFISAAIYVMALWSGCALISSEISNRRIRLIAVKPVHYRQLWLGRWLGLLGMLAFLLALSGSGLYLGLTFAISKKASLTQGTHKSASSLLKTYEVLSFEAHAETKQPTVLTPGKSQTWLFQLPRQMNEIILEYELISSRLVPSPITGVWRITDNREKEIEIYECETMPGIAQSLHCPLATSAAPGNLAVSYSQVGPEDVSVIVNPNVGPRLLVPAGSFTMNLVKGFVLILVHAALLAALGLTAGTIFSTPVAVFVSTGIFLSAIVGRSMVFGVPVSMETGIYPFIYNSLSAGLKPLQPPAAIVMLAERTAIAWKMVLATVLIRGIAGSAMLGCIAQLVWKRTQLALRM